MNGNFTICGEGSNGREAVAQAITLEPDLIILDVSMPILNGIEAARQIRRVVPATKILLLSMHDSSQLEIEAKACGADGVLSKASAAEQLVKVVERLIGDTGSMTAG